MLLALLAMTSAEAVDIAVSHGATTLTYQLEPGQRVDETWEGLVNPWARPRKREDLHVSVDLVDKEGQLWITVLLEAVGRKGTRVIAHPTMVTLRASAPSS